MIYAMLQRLAQNRDGVTAVEFAIIAMPLFGTLIGGFDLAYQAYATALVQGTTNSAARKATLENASITTIDTYVRDQLRTIANGTNLKTTATNFLTYNKIGEPEKLTTDVNGNGSYDKTGPDCFIDDNRNNAYDTASEGATGVGTAEDVVRYEVTVTYTRLSPVSQYLGLSNIVTIKRVTFLRNEPYAGIIDPPTKCGV